MKETLKPPLYKQKRRFGGSNHLLRRCGETIGIHTEAGHQGDYVV
jgi:hypothetical protein